MVSCNMRPYQYDRLLREQQINNKYILRMSCLISNSVTEKLYNRLNILLFPSNKIAGERAKPFSLIGAQHLCNVCRKCNVRALCAIIQLQGGKVFG